MPVKLRYDTVDKPRVLPRAEVSSGDRGGSFAAIIERLEKADPAGAKAQGLSGAAFRAGELIHKMRKAAGLSQTALGAKLTPPVTQARISELESGFGPQGPTWDVMERIAAACGTHIVAAPPELAAAEI